MLQRIKAILKKRFPRSWNTARTTKKLGQLLPRVYGYAPRFCSICGYQGKFQAEIHFPDIFTYDAICPNCGSLPRNRLLKLASEEKGLFKPDMRLLHFAPEPCVKTFVLPLVADYISSDLYAKPVDLVLDIEAIKQPDEVWDVIICSHVLEHVNHVKALSELLRILKPGGRLLALFPIVEGWQANYENAAIDSDHGRGLHFGKENHLRRFGANVRKDFQAVGFELECYAPISSEVVNKGLIPGENLFIATKPIN